MEITKKRLSSVADHHAVYQPAFFRIINQQERDAFEALLASDERITVHNEMAGQLRELIKSLYPSVRIKEDHYPALIDQHLAGKNIDEYGVWVYYPWSKKMIHLLDEEEFVEIRTNRNRYKITTEEQAILRGKKIGVIGLSVGQSIALTLAMERTCGELRLADFDTAELSNLNRIRTGVQNLGLKKTIIAAREIAEIDPFIEVKIFSDGLTSQNMDAFFTGGGKLDILVEVCDGLDIKIVSRYKARALKIPVVMDTNDRGMLDVERFDLQPERPILHGLAEGLDPENIKDLTSEEKIPYILRMVGAESISTRLKASMIEVEQSINTWPQLASSVVLGGAVTTDVCRRILLDQYHESGRYYIDIDEIVGDKVANENLKLINTQYTNPYLPLNKDFILEKAKVYIESFGLPLEKPDFAVINKIADAAIIAPSPGNSQPWKFYYEGGLFFIFHDQHKSYSWGDYWQIGSHISLGTAIENVSLKAAELKWEAVINYFPFKNDKFLVAAISFKQSTTPCNENIVLAKGLHLRFTNRIITPKQKIPSKVFDQFHYISDEVDFALHYVEEDNKLEDLAEIIAACDRMRVLNQWGHEEFFHELRWSKEEAELKKDGIDLSSAGLTSSELAGFRIARDWRAIDLLSKWNKGNAFKQNSMKAVRSASAMVLLTTEEPLSKNLLLNAGRFIERYWIKANLAGVSVHPMLSPVFFFNRLKHGHGIEIEERINELSIYKERFNKVFALGEEHKELFLMKLSLVSSTPEPSLRQQKEKIFFFSDVNY